MRPGKFALIAVAAAAICAGGCAPALHFQTIDGATGLPLAGVNTYWSHQESDDVQLGAYQNGPTNLPPSAIDGIITARGVCASKPSMFIFSRRGYRTAYCLYGDGILTEGDSVQERGLDNSFVIYGDLKQGDETNGVIVVPLSPVSMKKR